MRKVNYKSDFDFLLTIHDCQGNELPFPNYDFVAYIYTTSLQSCFVVKSEKGLLTNCYNDNGKIHIVCDNHGLSAGTLKVEFHAQIPNSIYPDGHKLTVTPAPLDIELVRGAGDCGCGSVEADLTQNLVSVASKNMKQLPPLSMSGVVKRRTISIGAEPGNVYQHSGRIKLGTYKFKGNELSIDLKEKYYKHNDAMTPFSEAIERVMYMGDANEAEELEYSIDGDVLRVQTLSHSRMGGIFAIMSSVDPKYKHICVQKDKEGNTIFTLLATYRECETVLARPSVTEDLIHRLCTDKHFKKIKGYQMQIWGRSKKSDYRWRWHKNEKSVSGSKQQYYLRIRRVNKNKDKSEWVYVSIWRPQREGTWTFREVSK